MKSKSQLIQQLMTIVSEKYSDRNARLADFGKILGYKVISTTNLTDIELTELIHCYTTGELPNPTIYAYFDNENPQHRKVLSLAKQLGWRDVEKPTFASLHILGCWIKSYRCPVAGKTLKKMEPQEVSKVIFALEQMVIKKFKR